MANWLLEHAEKMYRAGQNSVEVGILGSVSEEPFSDQVATEPPLFSETHVYRVWVDPEEETFVSINARSKEEAEAIFKRRRSAALASEYVGELNDILDR